jgi:hypothetical protein
MRAFRGKSMTTCRSAMMLTTWRAVAIAILALLTSTRADAAMCLDVALRFEDRKPPSALVEAMKRETEWIWNSYDVRIAWITADGAARCAWPLGSMDVLVTDDNQRTARLWRPTLGSTRVAPGGIEHVPVRIRRAVTEELVGLLLVEELAHTIGRPRADAADIGRALGRVLAHEIGHVILAATNHQTAGLMRATFHPLDLIRRERSAYTLSNGEVARLRCREVVLGGDVSASIAAPDDHSDDVPAHGVCSRTEQIQEGRR